MFGDLSEGSQAAPDGPEAHLAREVLEGYRQGAFPMAGGAGTGAVGQLAWFEADPRGVIRLDRFRIPRRLARTMRGGRFLLTADRAFGRVIRECGNPDRPGGWIDGRIVAIFEALHRVGVAHSVEAWTQAPTAEPLAGRDARLASADGSRVLVGGIYGLSLGAIFCGESMFSRPDLGGRDASKVCLAHLLLHLRARGYQILDTQMWSEHVAQFGCESVDREEYAALLASLRDRDVRWGSFDPGATLAAINPGA